MEDAKQKEGYGWPDSGNEGAERKRLPRRLMSGRLKDAAKRGRGTREKVWLDEVEKDVQAFDITGDWRQRATKAPEWHAAGTEGAQNFMGRWRAEEADKPSPVDCILFLVSRLFSAVSRPLLDIQSGVVLAKYV